MGLNFIERRQYARLEDVVPGGDVKPGDVDRAAEIVPRAESVMSRASDTVIPYGVRCRMTGQRGPPICGKNTKVLSLVPSRIATMAWKARARARSGSSMAMLRKKRAGDRTGSLTVAACVCLARRHP